MNELIRFLANFYSPEDYPALAAQMQQWQKSKPFAGTKILDATPVFRNTMVKYAVLLAGGADLYVSVGKDIPYDREILQTLPVFGIKIADEKISAGKFDAVADCAGRHAAINSRCGYAELTRSGLEYYRECSRPVFSVDSGILKLFETKFGTGESFIRAMKHLGYHDFNNKKIVIFGGGKVGGGTAFYCALAGADTFIIDRETITPPANVRLINSADKKAVCNALNNAWCIVSATGLPGVLAEYVPIIARSNALIANMGVENEFGETLQAEKILNRNQPLNFMLEEPTGINYIDPSMALSNAGLLMLLQGKLPAGINLPPEDLEMQIIDVLRSTGKMDNEINNVLKGYKSK
jgi:adenosylhomocysteinase